MVIISMSNNNYIIPKIDGARFFVSSDLYARREKNFLKRFKGTRVESCLALSKAIKQRYIYEIELKYKGANVQQDNFILPDHKRKGNGGFFFNKEHYRLINSTFRESVQKIILPESGVLLKQHG